MTTSFYLFPTECEAVDVVRRAAGGGDVDSEGDGTARAQAEGHHEGRPEDRQAEALGQAERGSSRDCSASRRRGPVRRKGRCTGSGSASRTTPKHVPRPAFLLQILRTVEHHRMKGERGAARPARRLRARPMRLMSIEIRASELVCDALQAALDTKTVPRRSVVNLRRKHADLLWKSRQRPLAYGDRLIDLHDPRHDDFVGYGPHELLQCCALFGDRMVHHGPEAQGGRRLRPDGPARARQARRGAARREGGIVTAGARSGVKRNASGQRKLYEAREVRRAGDGAGSKAQASARPLGIDVPSLWRLAGGHADSTRRRNGRDVSSELLHAIRRERRHRDRVSGRRRRGLRRRRPQRGGRDAPQGPVGQRRGQARRHHRVLARQGPRLRALRQRLRARSPSTR